MKMSSQCPTHHLLKSLSLLPFILKIPSGSVSLHWNRPGMGFLEPCIRPAWAPATCWNVGMGQAGDQRLPLCKTAVRNRRGFLSPVPPCPFLCQRIISSTLSEEPVAPPGASGLPWVFEKVFYADTKCIWALGLPDPSVFGVKSVLQHPSLPDSCRSSVINPTLSGCPRFQLIEWFNG